MIETAPGPRVARGVQEKTFKAVPAERSHEYFGGVVGWKHVTMPNGVDLTVQTAAGAPIKAVDEHHLLMTRNQALLMAKYLLDVTGQTLPETHPRSLLARIFR